MKLSFLRRALLAVPALPPLPELSLAATATATITRRWPGAAGNPDGEPTDARRADTRKREQIQRPGKARLYRDYVG